MNHDIRSRERVSLNQPNDAFTPDPLAFLRSLPSHHLIFSYLDARSCECEEAKNCSPTLFFSVQGVLKGEIGPDLPPLFRSPPFFFFFCMEVISRLALGLVSSRQLASICVPPLFPPSERKERSIDSGRPTSTSLLAWLDRPRGSRPESQTGRHVLTRRIISISSRFRWVYDARGRRTRFETRERRKKVGSNNFDATDFRTRRNSSIRLSLTPDSPSLLFAGC